MWFGVELQQHPITFAFAANQQIEAWSPTRRLKQNFFPLVAAQKIYSLEPNPFYNKL
jgi:hypothetical protein